MYLDCLCPLPSGGHCLLQAEGGSPHCRQCSPSRAAHGQAAGKATGKFSHCDLTRLNVYACIIMCVHSLSIVYGFNFLLMWNAESVCCGNDFLFNKNALYRACINFSESVRSSCSSPSWGRGGRKGERGEGEEGG